MSTDQLPAISSVADHPPNDVKYSKTMYTLSNVIVADEKWTSFHQYLRYNYKRGTIVFSTPSAII